MKSEGACFGYCQVGAFKNSHSQTLFPAFHTVFLIMLPCEISPLLLLQKLRSYG